MKTKPSWIVIASLCIAGIGCDSSISREPRTSDAGADGGSDAGQPDRTDAARPARADAGSPDAGDGGSDSGSDVPVAEAPMTGFWPHGYYEDAYKDEYDAMEALRPVIDALGTPQVVANTPGKGQDGWDRLDGVEWQIARAMPTDDTPWEYMIFKPRLIPWKAVREAPGDDLIEKRSGLLEQAANGEFNHHYRSLFRTLADMGLADKVILRIASEHNGVGDGDGWQPDSAIGNEDNWKRAWRQFVTTGWEVDERFLMGWSPSILHSKEIAMATWPGPEYVDYIAFSGIHDGHNLYGKEREICGSDCEFGVSCSDSCEEMIFAQVWEQYKRGEKWGDIGRLGLDDVAALSEEHDIPLAMPEWGLNYQQNAYSGNDNPRFIRAMWTWVQDHNVHWQTTFEARYHDGAFIHSGDAVERSHQAYLESFSTPCPADYVAPYRELVSSRRPKR